MLSDVAWQSSTGRPFQSFGAANENDLAPNVVSIFPLGWSNMSLPVDLRLYNEFDFLMHDKVIF